MPLPVLDQSWLVAPTFSLNTIPLPVRLCGSLTAACTCHILPSDTIETHMTLGHQPKVIHAVVSPNRIYETIELALMPWCPVVLLDAVIFVFLESCVSLICTKKMPVTLCSGVSLSIIKYLWSGCLQKPALQRLTGCLRPGRVHFYALELPSRSNRADPSKSFLGMEMFGKDTVTSNND